MKLVRWDPIRDLAHIHGRLNQMFSDGPWSEDEGYGSWVPPVEIFERGDDLVIRAELPGLNKEDIEIQAENGTLVLKGERKREPELDKKSAYRLERAYGRFSRSFALPTTVDTSKITASYKNGILEVILPKVEEAKPKRVEIQAA